MDLNKQAERAINNLLDSFPATTTDEVLTSLASDEVLSFARQAWYAGYRSGLDWMHAETTAAFARLHEAS